MNDGFSRMAALAGAAVCLSGCATTGMRRQAEEDAAVTTGFLTKSVEVDGATYFYSVYVPADYDPAKSWPLVLFLHGMGERGGDGLLQTEVGIGTAIRRHAAWFSCIVVMPQCPDTCLWDGATEVIDASLAQTREQYRIDPARIYLTGLSMGGFGAWAYGARHGDVFAALAPICGGGDLSDAARLAEMPIWAFHGADDDVVPPERSRKMVEAVKAAGGKVKYTEYPGVGHNSWDETYGNRKVITWLLRQRR